MPSLREVVSSARTGWGKPELRMPTLSILRQATDGLRAAMATLTPAQLAAKQELDCPDPSGKDWPALVTLVSNAGVDVDGFDALVQFVSHAVLTFPAKLLAVTLCPIYVEASRVAQRGNAHADTREALCRVLFALASRLGLTYELHDAIPSLTRFLSTAPTSEGLQAAAATTLQVVCCGSSLATESLLCSNGVLYPCSSQAGQNVL